MADVYQRVLLSPAVQQLLDQEYGCSLHMKELSERQERQWSDLTLRQTDELQAAVELLDEVGSTAVLISNLKRDGCIGNVFFLRPGRGERHLGTALRATPAAGERLGEPAGKPARVAASPLSRVAPRHGRDRRNGRRPAAASAAGRRQTREMP